MATLVFNLETVGENWQSLDENSQYSLTHWIKGYARDDQDRERLEQRVKDHLAFSPLTAKIAALSIYDLERKRGVVYCRSHNEKDDTIGNFIYKQRSEKDLLFEFWDGVLHYDTVVTFNGRGMVVPFLLHRSAALGIRPTKNLLESRYPAWQKSCRHIDLQDELTFFGAIRQRPTLQLFCQAYNIPFENKLAPELVKNLVQTNDLTALAKYSVNNISALVTLYQRWLEYLRFETETLDLDLGF